MRVVIQRVKEAQVSISNMVVGEIGEGLVILVGFTDEDDQATTLKMAKKVSALRIFDDADGKMNLSLKDIGGEILSISQFTLYGDAKKGNRPSFTNAANFIVANELYNYFNHCLAQDYKVETGEFGAYMHVELVNDGPVTLILDSKELF